MTIEDLAKNSSKLRLISGCRQQERSVRLSFSSINFLFDDNVCLTLKVDEDSDELLWSDTPVHQERAADLMNEISIFDEVKGLRLTWSWAMTNQQGYFDAMQLELTNDSLSDSYILQFKVAASGIEIFIVKAVEVNMIMNPRANQ